MSCIFNYLDYRQFLADYYEEKKRQLPHFSYQSFSQKVGFSSKSYIFNVIKGKKTLARASVVRICAALKFNKTEASYFENLVYFNQAGSYSERHFYFNKLNAIHPSIPNASKVCRLHRDQYEFYSRWYHSVVRSLIDLYPEEIDPEFFAKKISPPITRKQAQKSIELLLRLNLIVKKEDGQYAVTDKTISTGEDVQSLAIQELYLATMDHARNALVEQPRERRNFTGLTLGISSRAYRLICDEIQSCQDKILAIAENDTESDEVFQLNVQLYPVTKKDNKSVKSVGKDKLTVRHNVVPAIKKRNGGEL